MRASRRSPGSRSDSGRRNRAEALPGRTHIVRKDTKLFRMHKAVSGFFVPLLHVSEENSAAEFQKHRTGGARTLPRHQLSGGRQRCGQDQHRRCGVVPVDVQVVAADDRRTEHPPRRRLLPHRRLLPQRRRAFGERLLLLLAQGRQGAQAQRQGVRAALGPRGTDPRRDRLAVRQRADQRCRRRAAPLPQRLHRTARPPLSGRAGALQRRARRTQPPAEDAPRRDDAPDLRHAAGRARRADPRPAAGVRAPAATRRRGVLPHPLRRPRAGRAALPLGTRRAPVRRTAARRTAARPRQRVHHGGHPPRRPRAQDRRLSAPQIRLAGAAEVLPHRA